MTVDEILADPSAALNLDAGCVPVHVALIVEYAEPGSENNRTRLAMTADDEMSPWTSIGLLRFAMQLELDQAKTITTEEE